MNHEGVGVERTGIEIGPHDGIRPGGFNRGAGCSLGILRGAHERVLQHPASRQTDVQVDGVDHSPIPNAADLGILVLKRVADDDGAETAVLWDVNGGRRKLIAINVRWSCASLGLGGVRFAVGRSYSWPADLERQTRAGAGVMTIGIARRSSARSTLSRLH